MSSHSAKPDEARDASTSVESTRDPSRVPAGARSGAGNGDPHAQKRSRFPGLGRIVAFFVLVAALAFVLDAVVDGGLRRISTAKFGSMNRVFAGQVNADIIINGSSRALVHYDPRIITQATGLSAYNLGMNGVQIDVQLAVLKAYLSLNRKPRVVVQNLESFTFETTKPGEIYDPAVYAPYLGNDALYESLLRIDPVVWKWRHIPLYVYAIEDLRFTWGRGLLAWLGVHGRETYFQGFNPRDTMWTGDFEQFRAAVGPKGVTNRIESDGLKALEELVRLCRDSGIDVILAYSPVYFEMQALETNRAEIFATFEKLSREAHVTFWDFSQLPLARQRELFYNSQHLNARGAELFSQDFARRLSTHLASPPAPAGR